VYRKTPVAAIAARKMMQWYADPYTRVSIPTRPLTPVKDPASLSRRDIREFYFARTLNSLMQYPAGDSLDPSAILPSLTIPEIIHIIATEPVWKTFMQNQNGYSFLALQQSASVKPMAWKDLEARAVSAHEIVGLFSALPEPPPPGSEPLFAVTGFVRCFGVKDEALWLNVVKLAMLKKSPTGVDFPFRSSH